MYESALKACRLRDEIRERFLKCVRQEGSPCFTCTSAGCCKQLSAVDLYEAVYVVHHLRAGGAAGEDVLQRLSAQGVAIQSFVAAHGLDIENPRSYRSVMGEWFARNELCAAHTGTQCSIYPWRPICCSTYFLAQGDPSLCEPTHKEPVACFNNWEYIQLAATLEHPFEHTVDKDFSRTAFHPPLPLGVQVLYAQKLLTD